MPASNKALAGIPFFFRSMAFLSLLCNFLLFFLFFFGSSAFSFYFCTNNKAVLKLWSN